MEQVPILNLMAAQAVHMLEMAVVTAELAAEQETTLAVVLVLVLVVTQVMAVMAVLEILIRYQELLGLAEAAEAEKAEPQDLAVVVA